MSLIVLDLTERCRRESLSRAMLAAVLNTVSASGIIVRRNSSDLTTGGRDNIGLVTIKHRHISNDVDNQTPYWNMNGRHFLSYIKSTAH